MTSNTQKSPIIRIVEGIYPDHLDVDGMAAFLPENLSWQGPVNTVLLEQVGPELDKYILEHIHAPKSGTAFAVPQGIWEGPKILFAVVPNWDGGMDDEDRALKKCTRSLLELAEEEKLTSLAIPALGASRNDYPMRRAARLVISAIYEHHFGSLNEVRIVCKTAQMMQAYKEIAASL